MEIIAAIIGALIGVVLGAWINNIFTWKIQNRINALDKMYLDILAINEEYRSFYLSYISNSLNEENNPVDKTVIETAKKEASKKINPMVHRLYLHCFIVDGVKSGNIYKIISIWGNLVTETINTARPITNNGDQECGQFFSNAQDAIFSHRKEIISFCYMLKQLNPFEIVCKK